MTFKEVSLMENMGWSWDQLYNTPYTVVLATSRILELRAKKTMKDQKAAENKAKK